MRLILYHIWKLRICVVGNSNLKSKKRVADKNRLEELYQKYMDRTSTDPEIKELFDLIRESGDLAALRKVLKHRWDTQEIDEELTSLSWETIQHEMTPNQGKTKKSRSLILRLSIAASVLIVVGIATWTW